jgi:glucokinase
LRTAGEPSPGAAGIFAAARRDEAVRAVVRRFAAYYARAIQWLIMAYDVEKVVLAGGVSHAGPAFLEPILEELARSRSESGLARMMFTADKLVLMPTGYNAGAWGALGLARQAMSASPHA